MFSPNSGFIFRGTVVSGNEKSIHPVKQKNDDSNCEKTHCTLTVEPVTCGCLRTKWFSVGVWIAWRNNLGLVKVVAQNKWSFTGGVALNGFYCVAVEASL